MCRMCHGIRTSLDMFRHFWCLMEFPKCPECVMEFPKCPVRAKTKTLNVGPEQFVLLQKQKQNIPKKAARSATTKYCASVP